MAKKKTAKKKPTTRVEVGGSGPSNTKVIGTKIKAKKKTRKRKTAKKVDGTCFVMMPFREPFDLYYEEVFVPAIRAANLEPKLASDPFRSSQIVGDIWQMVQDAKVLLAELTTKNANVFYELGLAHAIGRPVVLVSETMDDVPFDLQALRVLNYDKNDPTWGPKLSESIVKSLRETLADPVGAVPLPFRKIVESKAPEQDATVARIENLEQRVRILLLRGSSTVRSSPLDEFIVLSNTSTTDPNILRAHLLDLCQRYTASEVGRQVIASSHIKPEKKEQIMEMLLQICGISGDTLPNS